MGWKIANRLCIACFFVTKLVEVEYANSDCDDPGRLPFEGISLDSHLLEGQLG